MARKTNTTIKLAVQAGHLLKYFPDSQYEIKRGRLTWTGRLRPSPLSEEYVVRLSYKLGQRPDVDVLSPELQERGGEPPPHVFPQNRLCLYLPRNFEWHGDMIIAKTIIPWASEWLFNYELWLATGEWCGGGEHPDADGKLDQDSWTQLPQGDFADGFETERLRKRRNRQPR